VETAWTGSNRIRALQGVRDSFCEGTPHFKWSKLIPTSTVLGLLPEKDPTRPLRLKGVSIGRRDRSGYVRLLKFETSEGTVRVRGDDLRKRLGPAVLRSTYLTKVSMKKDGVQFAGRGWGHGVGLCQWGARTQAQRGRKYRNILKFYYPGTKVAKWKT
jgi:stage II sporulation protein D